MAFIILRRSRNTKSYYLVESYRDANGRSRKRAICYLGRESDGTNTLEKALAHWENVRKVTERAVGKSRGRRRSTLLNRMDSAQRKVTILRDRITSAEKAQTERRRRERESELAVHWACFDRLRHHPTPENASAAKRAFLALAKVYHPDQGGTHEDFLQLKDRYDQARSACAVGGFL